MFRHFAHRQYLPAATIVLCLALVGCTDDKPQAQIDSLRSSLAAVNAEVASLRASRKVLQNRLAAAQIAARTAGSQLADLNSQAAELSAQNIALSTRNAALAQANAHGAQRLRAAEAAVEHVSGQLAAISQSMSASEFNNANLSRQLAAVSSLLGQRDAQGQSQENTLKNLQSDLHERAESIEDLSEELEAQQQMLQQAESSADRLRAQNEQLAAQLAALQSRFDTVRTRDAQRIAQLQRERGELDAIISGMRKNSQKMIADAQQLLDSNEQIKARMESFRHELADANDQALRYQVAKDYLNDKVQAQHAEIEALKKAASDARRQHKATMTTLLKQQDELRTAALTRGEILNSTIARAEAMQAESDGFRDQLERLRGEYAASEQRARSAKQAKDYLDGKLSAIAKELEEARSEHRMALLKNKHALRLSLEESRVLQQRERALSVQLQQAQEFGKQKDAELRALRDEVDAKIDLARAAGSVDGKAEGRKVGLNEGRAEREDELRALRNEVDVQIGLARAAGLVDGKAQGRDVGRIEGLAEGKIELDVCVSSRDASATTLRGLQLDNDSLNKELSALTSRLQALESAQDDCAVQKTQSPTEN